MREVNFGSTYKKHTINSMNDVVLSVSDFVALLSQTLEYAYPSVTIVGELANFRVSKNKWIYFDLKDEYSSLKFFGTVYQLPGPLEDGLVLQVRGAPRLHPQFGFSVNVQFMSPVGEGSLKKAATLLEAKLTKEGLFDPLRKRTLPYPPRRIGLITSDGSAAYHDFVKILNERWSGVEIQLADVQVQGEAASAQIVAALDYFNTRAQPVDVLVVTRGGGSADDLAVFSSEPVTRAVAGSRIPTLVAIGHEVDISLSEMAADQRASTPSNAAQLLVPDRVAELDKLSKFKWNMINQLEQLAVRQHKELRGRQDMLNGLIHDAFVSVAKDVERRRFILHLMNPETVLKRGYAIVRRGKQVVSSARQLKKGQALSIQFADGNARGNITEVEVQ